MLAGENQYAPMTGLPALREQLAAKIAASYGHHYDAGEEITITASASEACSAPSPPWFTPATR